MSRYRKIVVPLYVVAVVGVAAGVIVSCSNSSTPAPGGDIYGAADMHCIDPMTGMMDTQVTSQSACQLTSCAGQQPPCTPDAGTPPTIDAGADNQSDYGATMFDNQGFDDDCKYAVMWTSTPIEENTDIYFTVVASTTVDSGPATGANIFAEVFLDATHEAPPTNQSAVESPPGTYKVGPIRFDKPGAWTVRFHLHEDCKDLVDDSPHGHAAFYVFVP